MVNAGLPMFGLAAPRPTDCAAVKGPVACSSRGSFQCRLNQLLASCPDMISTKDNLVGGAAVAEPLRASPEVFDGGGW